MASSGSWVPVGETTRVSNATRSSHSRPPMRSTSSPLLRDRGVASTPLGVPISSSEIEPSDVVILVSGTTGSGISNFISKLTGIAEDPRTHDLTSYTTDVRVYACVRDRQRFVFVDTPGFNATKLSQRAVLRKAAKWLKSTYQNAIKLTGVIYMCRITDTYSSRAEQQSFRIFYGMCGRKAAGQVRLVTTMWDQVDDDTSAWQRQNRLEIEWESLLSAGALCRQFYNTSESAWEIVYGLGYQRKVLLLQRELVDERRKLKKTTAGMRAPENEVLNFFSGIRKLFKF
ncbi:hypothetical protein SCLCIDRAFT_1219370 [Scleroderma citrinum Foug A]|uniref:G domain-containing protein n=1 Tax=Scleroderma citrinum Foug A TaxID=1036808 RepID=A0A0C2Z6A9_9AGAM|nr:hypothetical protein SCLCIDRAFT_1219370 [Scleroderma citrinum Foug A]